jgi:hypothetical protein
MGSDKVGFEKVQSRLRGGKDVVSVSLRKASSESGTEVSSISVSKDTGTHVFGTVAGDGVAGISG